MADSKKRGAPRLRKADRRQLEMRAYDLDSLLPEDHRARLVWAAVEQLDLSGFYDAIDAREGTAGQAATDPAIFRRRETLQEHLVAAREQVERLRRELDDDPAASSSRQKAARERAAEDRKARLEHALREMPVVEALKDRYRSKTGRDLKRKIGEPRVSSTDPEARVMKMGDGGWRPAYNIQLPADTDSRFVVGVSVTNIGNDGGQIMPMLEQLERIYGQRAATIETVNADLRAWRGLQQLPIRGVTKVRALAMLYALTFNILRLPRSLIRF